MSYGKIFSSAFTGSMAGSGSDVFAVWSYVISHAIQGQVELNPILLSVIIGCPKDRILAAIDFLCSPDPESRNKEHEGRRLIREGQFAYCVVSHFIYRRMIDEDQRREYNRLKKREEREKKFLNTHEEGQQLSKNVSLSISISKKHKQETLKANTPPNPRKRGKASVEAEIIFPVPLDCEEFKRKWKEWIDYRKQQGFKRLLPLSQQKQVKVLSELGLMGAIASIEQSVTLGYQGLFAAKPSQKPKPAQDSTLPMV